MYDTTTNDITTTDDIRTELQDWLCAYLAEELRLPEGSIDPEQPMSAYGLDSVRAITLITEAEELTGCELDPNALWEFPTVVSFAGLLAEHVTAAVTSGPPLAK
ncbi:acyl carrier protein [Streptomyces sp. NL15-2K]|uniref:acyl carrier protein n=1 Tax=Streptomyces sp. NL15-2K TaxID=376149 RepID=UPI000F5706DA|nr:MULTISPECIES: acyl carrier protein [Actinomycetes]WKX06873.1 acyl carrier protein [Kutzneria buriramensis]GCB44043.1 acyl carrier protein [Streptomyces sp. NL15-2K]